MYKTNTKKKRIRFYTLLKCDQFDFSASILNQLTNMISKRRNLIGLSKTYSSFNSTFDENSESSSLFTLFILFILCLLLDNVTSHFNFTSTTKAKRAVHNLNTPNVHRNRNIKIAYRLSKAQIWLSLGQSSSTKIQLTLRLIMVQLNLIKSVERIWFKLLSIN